MTEKTDKSISTSSGTGAKEQRPPVVAVLGHIDHGKSTLLDYLRKSNIVEKEAGGITQHLGAYEVEHTTKEGDKRKLTFLDTPGHEAFQALRTRVTNVADIAILIVSAEDSVKAQTLEALKAIRESGIPFIVAINKIDKPESNVEKVIGDLSKNEVFLEGRGGDVSFTPISAKTGEGVDDLLEIVLLTADLSELVGDRAKMAEGFVIEAEVDPKRGTSGTLVIKDGTLRKGMCVVAGNAVAPVRLMMDSLGKQIEEASFSTPVQIVGFSSLPPVGAPFNSFATKKEADECAMSPAPEKKESSEISDSDEKTVIPVVIKADVAGSIEAIGHEIAKLENEKVALKILRSEVGRITESDLHLLSGDTGGLIIGFNTKADPGMEEAAERVGAELKIFSIIYDLSKWLAESIEKRTPKEKSDEAKGRAVILKTFSVTKDKQVIGARVESGVIKNGNVLRILRRDEEIGNGKILELQKDKSEVKEVQEGAEFGIKVSSKTEIAVGDIIEAF